MHVQRQRQVAGSLELKTAWSMEFQDSQGHTEKPWGWHSWGRGGETPWFYEFLIHRVGK